MVDGELVGKTIGGYEILELVGKGGMGSVFRARQISLDREVAFKLLAPQLAENEEFVTRFKREARSIAKVNHPNILQVFDVAEADGLYFIAMEFVAGENLSAKLRKRGFMEWKDCAEIVLQSARGLESAANAGIIHRDIKPDNLMITAEGVVKVSDFGLAKELSSTEVTQTQDLMGTPAYMSPEQCDGAALDTRTDIYSLGGTFYRAATGVLPFNAPTPVTMMYKHKHEPLIPPRQYVPALPVAMENVIMKMMAKNPDERFANMGEVAVAIEQALQGKEPNLEATMALTPAPLVAPGKTESAFAELVAMGDRFRKEGRPVAAVDCWTRALEIKPKSQEVHDRLRKAKEESTVASMKIADNLLEQGHLGSIRADLIKALRDNPENVDAREKLAALELIERRKREAILEIRKMLSANEHERALLIWDSLPASMRDKNLESTLGHIRGHVVPSKKLCVEADKLTREGLFEEAFAKWDEAIELDPANEKARLGRQETQRFHGRMESALHEGYDFSMQNKFDAAITCYEKALALCPGHAQAKKQIVEALSELARGAENRHDYAAAIAHWRQLLERSPGHKGAMERIEQATRKRAVIDANIEKGRAALGKSKFRDSIECYSKVLKVQPGNKTAVFGLAEARALRLRRRTIPEIILVLLLVGGSAIMLHLRFRNHLEQGDHSYSFALGDRPARAEKYDEAIYEWRIAKSVIVYGWLKAGALDKKIAAAQLCRELDLEEKAYRDGEEIGALEERIVRTEELLGKASADVMTEEEIARARFNFTWHAAYAYAKLRNYREADLRYQKALLLAKDHKFGFPDARQGDIHNAIARYLEAQAVLANQSLKVNEREETAARLLDKATKLWPDFKDAQTLLATLKNRENLLDEALTNARKLRDIGRVQARARQREAAAESFARARSEAEKVLKLQATHWDARKIVAEAEWRAETGADMAFFLLPQKNDQQEKEVFRAFALDRYEWPNEKGATPQAVSFAQAAELARNAGKVLPTLEEWRFAAENGGRGQSYSYGDKYDQSRGNTGGGKMQPWPAGSVEAAVTPDGVYDLTGNLAEWVTDPSRLDTDTEQFTIGGYFGSSPEQCRNSETEMRRADITHPQVGFRAAKRWELKRAK
jgi:tetratricopeptide (TPR) repeat protein